MKDVPFVANTSDDLHCQQAAYMMVAKYFEPDFSISWDEWSNITGYEEGKGTWALAALLWFSENGYSVRHISLFDFERFIKEGGNYLHDEFGKEVGEWQVEHSNIPKEIERTKELLSKKVLEYREPHIEDIEEALAEGHVVRVLLNSSKLNDKPGYVGHSVVVLQVTQDYVVIHDPGLPPMPNRQVKKKRFLAAWADPNEKAKEMDIISRTS